MKNVTYLFALLLILVSCNSEPTLQKYFVEKSETKDFVTIDVGTNFIKTDKMVLTPEEDKALKNVDKLNILVFQRDSTNAVTYEKENAKVKSLLKKDNYDELMKFSGSNGGNVSVNTKSNGEDIKELVLYMGQEDSGFGVIRVLGDDMTANDVMSLVTLLQKSNFDMEQLKPLNKIIKNQ